MNEEHYAKLNEGVEAWNKWREKNDHVVPDLSKADLRGVDLAGADLGEVNLIQANLCRANLHDADLRLADLSGVDLRWAILTYAGFGGAVMKGADLSHANFMNASLNKADLSGATLTDAHFDKADLRNATGLRLDGNHIIDAHLSPRAKDPWSVLRRTYSGPRYALHLIFLIAFLIPYIAKSLMWVGVTNTQHAMIDLQGTIQQAAETVADSTYQPLSVALEAVAEKLANYVPSEETGWKQYRVAQLLVGWDKSWIQVALVFVLLLYNALRGFLTFKVSLLREEEERSHYSPALSDYWWLFRIHQVVHVLLFVALASFAYHAWHWLTQEVWLPPWL